LVNNIDPCPQEPKQQNALSLLAQYSGSESDEEDNQVTDDVYRKADNSSSSDSSSSSSDSEDEKDIKVIEKKIREMDNSEGDSDDDDSNKKKKKEALKVKGELSIDDLPPIQDLQITVDERECMEIGVITTIVDQLGEISEIFSIFKQFSTIFLRSSACRSPSKLDPPRHRLSFVP
jgi:hypothetical protein